MASSIVAMPYGAIFSSFCSHSYLLPHAEFLKKQTYMITLGSQLQ